MKRKIYQLGFALDNSLLKWYGLPLGASPSPRLNTSRQKSVFSWHREPVAHKWCVFKLPSRFRKVAILCVAPAQSSSLKIRSRASRSQSPEYGRPYSSIKTGYSIIQKSSSVSLLLSRPENPGCSSVLFGVRLSIAQKRRNTFKYSRYQRASRPVLDTL